MLLRGNNIEHLFNKMNKGHKGLLKFESIIVQAKATKDALIYKDIERGLLTLSGDALKKDYGPRISQSPEGRDLQRFIRKAEKGGFWRRRFISRSCRKKFKISAYSERFWF